MRAGTTQSHYRALSLATLALTLSGCIRDPQGQLAPEAPAPYLLIDAGSGLVEDATSLDLAARRDRGSPLLPDCAPVRDLRPARDRAGVDARPPIDQRIVRDSAPDGNCESYCALVLDCAALVCSGGAAAVSSREDCLAQCEGIPSRQRAQSYQVTVRDPGFYCEELLVSMIPTVEPSRCF